MVEMKIQIETVLKEKSYGDFVDAIHWENLA